MFTHIVLFLIFNRARRNFNSENPDFIIAPFQADIAEHEHIPAPLVLHKVDQLSGFIRKCNCIYLLQTVSASFLFLFLNNLHNMHLF